MLSPVPSRAREAQGGDYSIADVFSDEELVYKIGVWVFDDVAIGKVVLRKGEGGEYVATLNAHTTGTMIDWLLRHRRDTYVSRMKLSEDGRRFITKSFEKTITMTGKSQRTLTVFDYEKNTMWWKRWKDGKEEETKEMPLPKGFYCDDPLVAFYNFRFGVYGPIEPGREYTIYTFPKPDHVPHITIRLLPDRDEEDHNYDYKGMVKLDKDIFGTKAGDVEIYFTKDMTPVEALVKQVIMLGDVRGKLTGVGINVGKR